MLKIVGNDVLRDGEKIGWIERGYQFFDENGKKLGYFEDRYVYNAGAKRIAYLDDNRVETYDGEPSFRLDDVREDIDSSTTLPDVGLAALRIFYGN